MNLQKISEAIDAASEYKQAVGMVHHVRMRVMQYMKGSK